MNARAVSIWKGWFVGNVICWTVYEYNKPNNKTGKAAWLADNYAIATGLSRGLMCGTVPPLFIWYVADEMRTFIPC